MLADYSQEVGFRVWAAEQGLRVVGLVDLVKVLASVVVVLFLFGGRAEPWLRIKMLAERESV